MKYALFFAALSVAACVTTKQNDPVFAALKANPPTVVPKADLVKLRAGLVACNVFNKGPRGQYQTCWFPSGKPTRTVQLYYYSRVIRGGIYPNNNLVTFIKI